MPKLMWEAMRMCKINAQSYDRSAAQAKRGLLLVAQNTHDACLPCLSLLFIPRVSPSIRSDFFALPKKQNSRYVSNLLSLLHILSFGSQNIAFDIFPTWLKRKTNTPLNLGHLQRRMKSPGGLISFSRTCGLAYRSFVNLRGSADRWVFN